jgi:hypothetical protein
VGDFASETVAKVIGAEGDAHTTRDEVIFSAQVLQAFDDSLLNQDLLQPALVSRGRLLPR